jgi:hypothetical protein
MKIEVTRAFFIAGQAQAVGSELDLPAPLARELIHNGKAAPAQDKPAPAPKAAPKAAKETKE